MTFSKVFLKKVVFLANLLLATFCCQMSPQQGQVCGMQPINSEGLVAEECNQIEGHQESIEEIKREEIKSEYSRELRTQESNMWIDRGNREFRAWARGFWNAIKNGDTQFLLGKKKDRVIQCFVKAVALAPTNSEAWIALSQYSGCLKWVEYSIAFELDHDVDGTCKENFLESQVVDAQLLPSRSVYEELTLQRLEDTPRPDGENTEYYRNSGLLPKFCSLNCAEKAVEFGPENSRAWLCLGRAQHSKAIHGEFFIKDARESSMKAVELDPQNGAAWIHLEELMKPRLVWRNEVQDETTWDDPSEYSSSAGTGPAQTVS